MTVIECSEVWIFLNHGYNIIVNTAEQAKTFLLTAKNQGFEYPAWWDWANMRNIVPIAFHISLTGTNLLLMSNVDALKQTSVQFCETVPDFLY